jgi:hypothetical protein
LRFPVQRKRKFTLGPFVPRIERGLPAFSWAAFDATRNS